MDANKEKGGFTMVELLAVIVIVAVISVIAITYIGNYVSHAKYTADKQTLEVLNEALNRYKTQGGNLAALTADAPIGNVLAKLQAPVSWARMQHKFLNTGKTYLSASLAATYNGRQYQFTRYDTYSLGSTFGAGSTPPPYTYADWEDDAQAAISSGNNWDFTQTASSTTISMDVRTTTNGGEIWVWWGDGSYETFTGSTESDTMLAHTYSSAATYNIKIYGDITKLESRYDDGRTNFGGDISTMSTLTYVDVAGYNTLSGSIAGLTGLTRLVVEGSNTISGSVAGLTNLNYLKVRGNNTITGSVAGLTGLTTLYVEGSNTLSGSIAGLGSCTYINVMGSNTLSGDISSRTGLTYLSLGGNNTVGGTVANLTNLTYLYAWGVNTLYGSLENLTGLTYLNIRGSNDITGPITNLTNLTYLYAAGDNSISGDISGLTGLTYVELWSGASVSGSVTNLSNLEVLICGSAVTVTGSVAGKPIGKLNLYSNTSIDEASIVSMSGTSTQLCYIKFASGYTMSSAQVDTVLQNIWNNRNATKYDSNRYIYMKYGNIEAPTATGETYKANLQAAGWSVTTY